MGTILLIILILLLVGALPTWPYSTGWGYLPNWRPRSRIHYYPGPRFDGKDIAVELPPIVLEFRGWIGPAGDWLCSPKKQFEKRV